MESPALPTFRPPYSGFSLSPSPPDTLLLFHRCSFRRSFFRRNSNRSSLRFAAAAAPENSKPSGGGFDGDGFFGSSKFVEVIGIGSRKEAVVDFCLESPFSFSSLRFWHIMVNDSGNAQLQRRIVGKVADVARMVLEVPMMSSKLCQKAVILVASAGYGLDLVIAIDILKTIRSANGYVVTIIMKPFSFEGQRRQEEARNLMEKLQEHTNLIIGLDTDMLLKKDLLTLDEAVKTANNAVLMAITAVFALTSDAHRKFIDASHYDVKNIEVTEVIQVLERFKEAKIGFGAGYNIKTSILRSMYDCPFLSVGVKDLDGMVVCIVASSGAMYNNDVQETLRAFRQTTEYEGEILISTINEPSLEPNLLVTTVFILGFAERQVPQRSSILSGLAQHFPFFFNLFSRHQPQSNDAKLNSSLQNACLSEKIDSSDPSEIETRNAVDVEYSEEAQTGTNSNYNDFQVSSSGFEQNETGIFEAGMESSGICAPITEETPAFQRQLLASWNLGQEYQIAKDWGKEKGAEDGATLMLDNLNIFSLPVGVRSPEELKGNISLPTQNLETKNNDVKSQSAVNLNMSSWSSLTDSGMEAVREFYSSASELVKGKDADNPKQRNLSARAASMLEAERDAPKKWSPMVEMQYRGGIYRGKCQGGLPEGKGRLILGDGSIYDGMWRYGKRSGLGTFYFSNGDTFQGSWRDDAIHGKGWLYFHTGDRWFANFWKGKANGESRFYSKSGHVFFGHFQDGWRHGQFICIDVNGTRCIENWDQGVLVNRKLDTDICDE